MPDARAQLETLLIGDVTPAELEVFLAHGYRRFGPSYFRPRCAACAECVSLRVPVASFVPTKSQRRAAKRATRLRRTVGTPIVDDARLALYERWHRAREEHRGWEPNPVDPESYAFHFAFPHPSAREITFHDGDRLVAVGLWDATPNALSAVFFYFEPELARDSLGVANVVLGIDDARRAGRSHVYLGYRVEGCASLAYKARYGPHEILLGRPRLDAAAVWTAPP